MGGQMDSKQIDLAMKHRVPVMYEGRRYEYIKERVMWYDERGKRRLSLVLLDGRLSHRVPEEKVTLAEDA